MNWIWSSSLLQWGVIFVLSLLLFTLMRQAGEFANSLEGVREPDDAKAANPEKPVKPRKPDWEPFSRFPDCSVPLLGGGNFRLGLEQKLASLVVFFTPGSSECRLSPESIKEFFRNSLPAADFGFLAVVDMERSAAEKFVIAKSLESVPMAILGDIPENIRPEGVLFAVGIKQDGTIAARGRPRSVTHLIEMAYAVQQMAEMCPAHSRQQHDWGESAPYWSPRQAAGRSHSPEEPEVAKASVS